MPCRHYSTAHNIIWNRSKIRHMKASHSGREAKEFLISKIVSEAQGENVPLSEVERKMLYFTESGWTLPDIMKVSADFDLAYDQDKYEQKIAELVAKADRRIRKGSGDDYDKWWAAIRFLEREDHYISVMVRGARLRPRGDQFRFFVAGLGIATCLLTWAFQPCFPGACESYPENPSDRAGLQTGSIPGRRCSR